MKREQKRKAARRDEPQETTDSTEKPSTERSDLSETDALLEEIDAALEGVEQDLAATFVQKGGQ